MVRLIHNYDHEWEEKIEVEETFTEEENPYEWLAELTPEERAFWIKEYMSEG